MPNDTEPTIVPGKEYGEIYVTSWGEVYPTPTVTSEKLQQYRENYYGAGITRKLVAIFMGSTYEIEVTAPDGEPAEDLQQEITNMAKAQDVALWDKMKIGWQDKLWMGAGIFNPVWEQDGTRWYISKIRRLPPGSFATPRAATAGDRPRGRTLKGIEVNNRGEIECWQTVSQKEPTRIRNVHLVRDTTSTDPAGTPEIKPVVPVLTYLDFAWKAQIQKINRVGAPLFMIRIVQPKGDDVAYAKKIVKSWGKDTGFILRENFEVIEFNFKDSESALQTIEHLTDMVLDYWVPTSMISKDGSLINNAGNSQIELLYRYIAGIHRDIEATWEPLLQKYLDANGYEDHRVRIVIPDPKVNDHETAAKQAELGAETGTLTTNEIRTRLGAHEMSEDEIMALPVNQRGGSFTAKEEENGSRDIPQQFAHSTRIQDLEERDPNEVNTALVAKETEELVDAIDRMAAKVIGGL